MTIKEENNIKLKTIGFYSLELRKLEKMYQKDFETKNKMEELIVLLGSIARCDVKKLLKKHHYLFCCDIYSLARTITLEMDHVKDYPSVLKNLKQRRFLELEE